MSSLLDTRHLASILRVGTKASDVSANISMLRDMLLRGLQKELTSLQRIQVFLFGILTSEVSCDKISVRHPHPHQ